MTQFLLYVMYIALSGWTWDQKNRTQSWHDWSNILDPTIPYIISSKLCQSDVQLVKSTLHNYHPLFCQITLHNYHPVLVWCNFFYPRGGAVWRRVCFQQGLPRIVHSFIHSLIQWVLICVILLIKIFKTLFIPNRKSWEAEVLKECSPPTMCHMTYATCHMSWVMCIFIFIFCKQILTLNFFWTKRLSWLLEGLLSMGPTPSS